MWSFKQWRRRRVLDRSPIPEHDWRTVCAEWRPLSELPIDERARLRDLTALFLHEKVFEGARGFTVTNRVRLTIASRACLPILNLGLDWCRGWTAIIVYPDGFMRAHTFEDDAGVVHTRREPLCGEAWSGGPVVLSWPDVHADTVAGSNLVIHELAHKLDMRNGVANGMPPLHREMSVSDWTRDFSRAYEDLRARLMRRDAPPIDPYAAEDPAEFFAVISELFFETPEVLLGAYPVVYGKLREFYKQDPAARL